MTDIVSVLNVTSLVWVISQSTGLKLAAKSVLCAHEAMAASRQTHSTIKDEQIFPLQNYTVFRIKKN